MNVGLLIGFEPTDEQPDYEIDVSSAQSGWELVSEGPPGYDANRPTRPAAWPHEPTEYTYVGVDLGVRNLLAAAPADAGVGRGESRADSGRITNALTVDGEVTRALYREMLATVGRLRKTPTVSFETRGFALGYYFSRLRDRIDAAIAEFLGFCEELPEPLAVVVEDFGYSRRSLVECVRRELDAGTWLLPQTRYRLAAELTRRDVRVTYVDPAQTTRTCHACGEPGMARDRFRCLSDDCPVRTVNRDRNAAVNIAQRGGITSRTPHQ